MKTRICFISDSHNKYKLHIGKFALPPADILVHCGDMTSMGYEHEVVNFYKWFNGLHQYGHKIFIPGNHDWLFESYPTLAKSLFPLPCNFIYLEDSGIELRGLKFYGTPVQPPFCDWAFNREEKRLIKHWEAIPEDIDVLITHCPPFGILDSWEGYNPIGSKSLLNEVQYRIKPKVHAFGHSHGGYGVGQYDGITFINASNLNNKYEMQNKPILIEINDDGNVERIEF